MCKFRHIDGGFLRWSAKCIAKRFRPLVRTLPGDEYGNRLNRYIIIIILVLLTCGPEQPAPETRAQFARAQALYRNRHFDESLAALQPVRAANPDFAAAAVLEARIHFFTRRFEQAERVLTEALAAQESPYTRLWLGRVIAVHDDRQDEAADHFRTVIASDPENYMAHYYLGRCLEAGRNWQAALVEYETALAMEYQLTHVHAHMATLFGRLEMRERARQHYERLRQLGASEAVLARVASAVGGEAE